MRTFAGATLVAMVLGLGLSNEVFADDKADIKQAVTDCVKKAMQDKDVSLQNAQKAGEAAGKLYSDEVVKAITGGDPAKLKAKRGQDSWFKSSVGTMLVKGSAAYQGKVDRMECVAFANDKAAVAFQAKPDGVKSVFIPYKDGKLDLTGLKFLQPEQLGKVWLIKAPGAGYIQMIQLKK